MTRRFIPMRDLRQRAMRLLKHAAQFDVMVTENLFSDILTDEVTATA